MFILRLNFVCSQNFFELGTRLMKALEPPLLFHYKSKCIFCVLLLICMLLKINTTKNE